MAKDNKNLKLIIIIALLVIIIAAGTSFTVMKIISPVSGNLGRNSAETNKDDIGQTYQLGEFTVNLANSGGYKFVKTNIVVEINDKKMEEELNKRKPQIRDIIISILRAQEIEDVEEPGGNRIKSIIKNRINSIVAEGEITSVWFTDFIVQ